MGIVPLVDEGLGNRELGGLTLEVIATPGHTPEHVAYLLRDGALPVALFSGGTLMAGGVARPDLLSDEQTEPLARAAFRSIHQRLLTSPDELPVYPTHGAGSLCSVAGGGERTTTIGRELGTLTASADAVPGTSLLVHCGHGERAMSAASLLHRTGHDDVAVLAGGPGDLGELEAGGGA
jgi:glyoxylase-like metal-dependent hydrolase (beta-lactamase superfamily II)